MRCVLNVAEKPSVAKSITEILSNGHYIREYTNSKTNPVYSFSTYIDGEASKMYFTSVRGHLITFDFDPQYRNWNKTPIQELFTAPINSCVSNDSKDIEKNILHYAKICTKIILWLDCDREGEAIAFEVLSVFQRVNRCPIIRRAIFSAVTKTDIEDACNTLRDPNKNLAMAVETRQEIDLRIGSSMTRFMTLKYKNMIETKANVLSYGPCQLPTLGFIVERFNKIESFIREPFWTINVTLKVNDIQVVFYWDRIKLFDRLAVLSLYEICLQNPISYITKITNRQIKKYPPLPLDTVEMNKFVCKYLKISSSKCMQLAEGLYNKGYISYPRTETNIFPNSMDLLSIVNIFNDHPDFSFYANKLLNGGFCVPLMGDKNDKAHPPIHPVKSMLPNEAESQLHWDLYEFITRHFLACCSEIANGSESNIFIDISGEGFHTKGLVIRELNWLEIYKYEKWLVTQMGIWGKIPYIKPHILYRDGKIIPNFMEGQEFIPSKIILKEGKTTPPSLITESKLIDLMNKNGIGTDATMHEHIQKIQDRFYTIKNNDFTFIPTNLGKCIYTAFKRYTRSSVDLTKPILRARMESDMNDIANGYKDKSEVIHNYSILMKNIYLEIASEPTYFDQAMNTLTRINPDEPPTQTISTY